MFEYIKEGFTFLHATYIFEGAISVEEDVWKNVNCK